MSEKIHINKSLIKKVVTFLNEYIDNPNIICGYLKYPDFISISIQIWDLNDSYLNKNISTFYQNITSEIELDSVKIKIKEEIDETLKQLND